MKLWGSGSGSGSGWGSGSGSGSGSGCMRARLLEAALLLESHRHVVVRPRHLAR